MGGLFDHNLIPLLFVLVMLANVFLDRRNRRRRQQEQPQETAEPIPTSISIKINTRIPLRISVFLRRLRRRS